MATKRRKLERVSTHLERVDIALDPIRRRVNELIDDCYQAGIQLSGHDADLITAGRPVRVAQDEHDLLVWRFNQASGAEPNQGSGGPCDATPYDTVAGADLPIRQVPGRFGYCTRMTRNGQRFASALTPAIALPTGNFTASMFFKIERNTGGWQQLFQKNWDALGGVGAPYGAPKLAVTSADLLDAGFIRTAATAYSMGGGWGGLGAVGIGTWHWGVLTYNDTTLAVKAYLDGGLIASETLASAHDAPAGPWCVGGWGSASTIEMLVGLAEDFRVADVERSASYIRCAWALAAPGESYLFTS